MNLYRIKKYNFLPVWYSVLCLELVALWFYLFHLMMSSMLDWRFICMLYSFSRLKDTRYNHYGSVFDTWVQCKLRAVGSAMLITAYSSIFLAWTNFIENKWKLIDVRLHEHHFWFWYHWLPFWTHLLDRTILSSSDLRKGGIIAIYEWSFLVTVSSILFQTSKPDQIGIFLK